MIEPQTASSDGEQDGSMPERWKEVEIAELLNKDIAEVFAMVPLTDSYHSIGQRIRKMRHLGLDTTKEQAHLQYMGILREIDKMIKAGTLSEMYRDKIREAIDNVPEMHKEEVESSD